jgi:hypothetical protein
MSTEVEKCLALLAERRVGKKVVFLEPDDRQEQSLRPLTASEQALAATVLDQVGNDESARAQIEALEPERVLAMLQSVIAHPKPVTRAARKIFTYISRTSGSLTWMLEMVGLARTGVVVRCVMWDDWPDEVDLSRLPPYPELGSVLQNQRTWWMGFRELRDDRGTQFRDLGQAIGFQDPVRVEGVEMRGHRMVQWYRQNWFPRLARASRWVALTPEPMIRRQLPDDGPPPWKEEEVQMFSPDEVISIEMR